MTNRVVPFCLLLTSALIFPAAAASAQTLPPGKGRKLVQQVCTQCHDLGTITAQHMSRQQWISTINTMISNGATATGEQFAIIADYLTKNFGPAPAPGGAGSTGSAAPEPAGPASHSPAPAPPPPHPAH